MDLGLKGRTALVLGSSQGLGHAVARSLVEEGAQVILTGRSAEKLASAAAELGAADAVRTEELDLADPASVQALIGKLGDQVIDILVLNGGGPPPGPVADVQSEEWRRQFAAMVEAPLAIAGAVLPGMRARRFGRVIALVSSGVQQPIPNLGISNTLRASIIGWAKTLAGEVAADGVTVNSVVPGRIHTARVDQLDAAAAKRTNRTAGEVAEASRNSIPMKRYGKPQEFADAVAFLASERASYITGTTLRVDGGMIAGI
ncbi:3-oxoacyl-[acyl-carrier protein] reductase [Faunimonas pinastri]|uniref:3-oxoacyl-[acyl-carrier protein] reductase n=1 Tax=Faunimonas pinastri TaxID=1855383 RepID=A0A1H9ES65_9HYPH|nr:SDR family oxidoreductase [Faunimonas pinastri]SEQ28442.1 3-oxoacyl-[acyl-carrier protein] reductase [Faunimonas pinastri]